MKRGIGVRLQLLAGVALTPLFFFIVMVLSIISEGFSWQKHPISALSLGQFGFFQKMNFIITGILAITVASGFWNLQGKELRLRIATVLLVVLGIGMIISGLFSTDPAFGFPIGVPEGLPDVQSFGAVIHSMGFYSAFTALTTTCFVFAFHFRAEQSSVWTTYSILAGLTSPVLIGLGMTLFGNIAGIFFAISGLISMGWLSAVAFRYYKITAE